MPRLGIACTRFAITLYLLELSFKQASFFTAAGVYKDNLGFSFFVEEKADVAIVVMPFLLKGKGFAHKEYIQFISKVSARERSELHKG